MPAPCLGAPGSNFTSTRTHGEVSLSPNPSVATHCQPTLHGPSSDNHTCTRGTSVTFNSEANGREIREQFSRWEHRGYLLLENISSLEGDTESIGSDKASQSDDKSDAALAFRVLRLHLRSVAQSEAEGQRAPEDSFTAWPHRSLRIRDLSYSKGKRLP